MGIFKVPHTGRGILLSPPQKTHTDMIYFESPHAGPEILYSPLAQDAQECPIWERWAQTTRPLNSAGTHHLPVCTLSSSRCTPFGHLGFPFLFTIPSTTYSSHNFHPTFHP